MFTKEVAYLDREGSYSPATRRLLLKCFVYIAPCILWDQAPCVVQDIYMLRAWLRGRLHAHAKEVVHASAKEVAPGRAASAAGRRQLGSTGQWWRACVRALLTLGVRCAIASLRAFYTDCVLYLRSTVTVHYTVRALLQCDESHK